MSLIGHSRFEGAQKKPEVIGHRGFRGKFPENTLLALREGAKGGATVLETDIQLAADGVVVMCHDVTTGRVYDANHSVVHTPYNGVLDGLRTKDKYAEPMPTLEQVLQATLHDPDFSSVKIMIDIKRSNEPHVIPYLLDTLHSVAPLSTWRERIILGVWRLDVLAAVEKHIPSLDIVHIGWQQGLAKAFIAHDQVKGISVNFSTLAVKGGSDLMDLATQANKDIYTWTVNSPESMKWAVASRVKGIITDYPDVLHHFLETISEKDLMSEYFTSEPNQFYSARGMVRLYAMYLGATLYITLADNFAGYFPWLFPIV